MSGANADRGRRRTWLLLAGLFVACSGGASEGARRPLPTTGERLPLFVYGGGGLAGRYPVHYTDAQIATIAWRFDAGLWLYGDTGVSEALVRANPAFRAYLYYDLTWAGCYQVGLGNDWMPCEDWAVVEAHADHMLAHNREPANPHPEGWIRNPVWADEFFTNMLDVDPADRWNPEHWIGFFLTTVRRRVLETGSFAGVFVDEAMPPIPRYPLLFPDGYDRDRPAWLVAIAETVAELHAALAPTREVLFNGWQQADLFEPAAMTAVAAAADGALIECFATCYMLAVAGRFPTQALWRHGLDLALRGVAMGKAMYLQAAVGRNGGGTEDARTRLFALASYLLVHRSGQTWFFFNDTTVEGRGVQYYPEWTLPLAPARETAVTSLDELAVVSPKGRLYRRRFAGFEVWVNPGPLPVPVPGGPWYRLAVAGGGPIPTDGSLPGTAWLEPVDRVVLEPMAGAILFPRAR